MMHVKEYFKVIFEAGLFSQLLILSSICILMKLCLILWRHSRVRLMTEKIPGPKSSFLLGNAVLFAKVVKDTAGKPSSAMSFQLITGLVHVLRRTTSLISFWFPFQHCVVLHKAEAVEPLLNSNTELDKSQEYTFLQSWLGMGLLMSTGQKWKQRRKMLTPTFHFRILEEFQPVISEQSQILVQVISKLPNLYSKNIMDQITSAALDIICETALGVKIRAQQTNQNSEYVRAIHSMGSLVNQRSLSFWLWNNLIYSLTPYGREWNRCLATLHGFTKKVIKDRKQTFLKSRDNGKSESKRRLAFLDILLEEHFKDSSFTEQNIQDEVDTFAFEGHDTTAAGLLWCLYMLGLYQDIQDKVYQELQDVFGEDKDGPITLEHLKQLKYLECAIKESQRLYPSVPIFGRRLKENTVLDGNLVPAGTTCYILPPALHRNPDVFPNPEHFDPDRFLPENSVGRHPFAYIPFSAGPRNCIGQKFALNEEKTVIANVIRNFEVKSLDHRDVISVCPELVSRPSPAIRMQFRDRSNN